MLTLAPSKYNIVQHCKTLLACLLLTHFLGLQFSDLVILNIAMRGAAQTQVQSCILSSKSGFLLVLVKTWKLSILRFDTTPCLRK